MSSLLFVPAVDARKVERACALPVRGVILDLEDGVSASAKPAARANVARFAAQLQAAGQKAIVRINAVDSPEWLADIAVAVAARIDTIVVPKCEGARALAAMDEALASAEDAYAVVSGTTRLIVQVETARGLAHLDEILASSARATSATLGLADLCADLGVDWDDAVRGDPPLFVDERLRLAIASRAASLEPPWDSVFLRIDDGDGFERDARLGRRLGCQGKLIIHPAQIGPVTEAYRMPELDRARAERIVSAYEEAAARGIGALRVDGLMVDAPVVARARALLEPRDGA
jgi:citrate lyase subunit beta/citryl-CoA lyase